jgi:hypothetical protein
MLHHRRAWFRAPFLERSGARPDGCRSAPLQGIVVARRAANCASAAFAWCPGQRGRRRAPSRRRRPSRASTPAALARRLPVLRGGRRKITASTTCPKAAPHLVIYVPEASAETLDNHQPRARSTPRTRPRTPAAPRREEASGGLSACLVRSCAQGSDGSAQRGPRLLCSPCHPILHRMRLDHPFDHPDDPTGPVWIRLDRRGIQREQARSSGADQIDAEHQSTDLVVGFPFSAQVCAELGGDAGDCTAHAADRMGSVLASHGGDPLPREDR